MNLGAETTLANMIVIERAYTNALGAVGKISPDIAAQAATAISDCQITPADLAMGTGRDGVVVPALVAALRSQIRKELHGAVHTGLTSQDVIDTSLVLALKPIIASFETRIQSLIQALNELDARHGCNPLQGRTRMQAALPITVAERLRVWREPLTRHLARLELMKPNLLVLQLGGALGDRRSIGEHAARISASMAHELGIFDTPQSWHSTRDGITEFANWLSLVTGSLGKMGQDMALMAQQGINEIEISGGGGSSAMAHKQNPVLSELLITLAKFNAVQASGMHHALVHEQERSGSAWALEWMILPQMIMATGSAILAGLKVCRKIERIGSVQE